MHQGEFVQTPLGFPRGEAGRLDGSSEPARLTEEGWRQPKYCLHFVRWYQPQIIADYFPLFSFIYNMEKVFIKQATFSTHRTLHENFGARHPSSVFFGNRFRSADCQKIQLPPGGSQVGLVRIRPGFHKTAGAYRNPSAAAAAAPLSGALFLLPPLGEVPRSGKGGVVGILELFPFNEPHPLSQPCRFRRAVKSASSPTGEPSIERRSTT